MGKSGESERVLLILARKYGVPYARPRPRRRGKTQLRPCRRLSRSRLPQDPDGSYLALTPLRRVCCEKVARKARRPPTMCAMASTVSSASADRKNGALLTALIWSRAAPASPRARAAAPRPRRRGNRKPSSNFVKTRLDCERKSEPSKQRLFLVLESGWSV